MADIVWQDRKRLWCGLPWTFTKYILTAKKLTIDTGLLNTRQDEVRLYRILDVALTRNVLQRLFGLGTIHCVSTDRSLKNFHLINVRKPEEVKDQLSDLIEQARQDNRVSSRELISADDVEDDDDHDDDGEADDETE